MLKSPQDLGVSQPNLIYLSREGFYFPVLPFQRSDFISIDKQGDKKGNRFQATKTGHNHIKIHGQHLSTVFNVIIYEREGEKLYGSRWKSAVAARCHNICPRGEKKISQSSKREREKENEGCFCAGLNHLDFRTAE